MNYLHDAHLANVITSYATLLGGLMPVLYCLFTRTQPLRWLAVYVCMVITAIPTILHHVDMGNHFMTTMDGGTNLLLVGAVVNAVAGDFMSALRRHRLLACVGFVSFIAVGDLIYRSLGSGRGIEIRFGTFGGFMLSELVLIGNGLLIAILFVRFWRQISPAARPFLVMTLAAFVLGAVLATASDSQITSRFFAWHAAWHIVGGFGFVTFWVFNHIRFFETTRPVESVPEGMAELGSVRVA